MATVLRFVLVALVGAGVGGTGSYYYVGAGSDVERTIGDEGSVSTCSFNIQFVGHFLAKREEPMAAIVGECDVVVVQELVAPPMDGAFPDGEAFEADPQARELFEAMAGAGFDFLLSEEDTGTNDEIHLNGPQTEWFVAFFDPDRLEPADDLPSGFLADDRSNHPDFERVPHAFAFRTTDDLVDFVLVSVHLMPGNGPAARARRAEEMAAIARWIDDNDDDGEQDFIIVGDMNLQNRQELADITPPGFLSLNNQFLPTNTQRDQSYDHVMLNPYRTSEVDLRFGFLVLDLRTALAPAWDELGTGQPYPGDQNAYDHNAFRMAFSDHNPVVFKLVIPAEDDD